MKDSLICLLLIIVLAACSYEKKQEESTMASTEVQDTIQSNAVSSAPDSLEVNVQQKAQEIDDLLKGI